MLASLEQHEAPSHEAPAIEVIGICQLEVSTLPPAPPPAPQVQQATSIVVNKGDDISFNGDEFDSNGDDSKDDIDGVDDDEFDYGIDNDDLLVINIDAAVAQNHLYLIYLQQKHQHPVSEIHSYLSSLINLAWCQAVSTDLLMCKKEKFTRENLKIYKKYLIKLMKYLEDWKMAQV